MGDGHEGGMDWRARVLPMRLSPCLLLLVAAVHQVNVDLSSQHRSGMGAVR